MDTNLGERRIKNISKVVVGKLEALELLLIGLFVNGHVLLEDVPGVGKPLVTKSLTRSFNSVFKRIHSSRCDQEFNSGPFSGI